MMDNRKITELTVEELKHFILETVQEAVAEVMIEFSIAAEHDAELMYQAELADMLRASLRGHLQNTAFNFDSLTASDD